MKNPFRSDAWKRIQGFVPAALIAAVIVVLLISAGAFFFYRGKVMMQTQLKDKLRSTAAVAAMQFEGEEIRKIKDGDSIEKSSALKDAVIKLNAIRDSVTGIRFAYIMKRTEDPKNLAFVADADLLRTQQQLDHNKNGTVDSEEEPSHPGDLYDWTTAPVLLEEAFLHAAVDEQFTDDQWGKVLSGYAPIRTKQGRIVAIVGLDMAADDYESLSQSIFSPIAFSLIALAALCIGGSIVLFLWRRRLEGLANLEAERSGLMRLAFHQIGGPLTIINWSLQELEEDGPTSIQRTIVNIHEGVKRLSGILKTLKKADLVHADRLEYNAEFASLTSIVRDVIESAGTRLTDRGQRVRFSECENITMRLDTAMMAGVVEELLTNAMDFSPDGAEIIVRLRKDGTTARLEVQDFGCGIPACDLSRVCDEFARGTNATRFKADGNGLGLYIVKGVVTRAGGTIAIASREGRGTTVTVKLPIV